jgi:hypothetical protein
MIFWTISVCSRAYASNNNKQEMSGVTMNKVRRQGLRNLF